MILEDLLERLEDIEVSDTYLYFIYNESFKTESEKK